ncbi:MarR family transcriptional regulator [soil metagenome]
MQRKSGEDLATALLRAARVMVGVAARSLDDENDVTVTQFRTLVLLDRPGVLNLVTLAGLLDVGASTAQRMVERLVRHGLVARERHPDNGREIVLQLTDDGHELVGRVIARRRRALGGIARRLPQDTRAAFVEALDAFSEAAGEPVIAPRDDAVWDL